MKYLTLLSFLFILLHCSFSQQLNLEVVDSKSNEPLPFVTVYLKKNGVGTTTNLEGIATISIGKPNIEKDTLICSFIGYERKVTPIDLNQQNHLKIQLTSSIQDIEEVTVVGKKKQLSAKQIVRKILKNTSKNYPSQAVNLLGFYRETFREDDQAVYLNEASINIHYNKYPQGRFERRDWKDWHYDDTYAFEFNFSQFNGFPNQFNSKGDRVELIEARSTENWSKYGFKGSIVGGPLSITSKDYLKYQSDFLDTKNFNKYAYEKRGYETINGKKCYVIHFHPLETGKKMSISFGRKLNRSIYVGEMYVDRESFAVVRMKFQLAQNVDFGYYQQFVPLDYRVEIDYKKHEHRWALDKIKLMQLRSYRMRTSDHKVLYESEQELFFTDIITDSVSQIPLNKEWKHTRITTLRDHEVPYNPNYWKLYEKEKYPTLPNSVISSLTSEKTLEEQFQNRFKQKKDVPSPIATTTDYTFFYPTDTLQDPYQWFSDPKRSVEFYQYIESENEYADNFIISARNHQKNFFKSMYNFYPRDTSERKRTYKPGQIIYGEDSLYNSVYYEYLDSTNRIPVFNLTQFSDNRRNCYVQKIKFSKAKVAVQYTNNGGLNNNLIILNKGSQVVEDSLSEIYSFEWLNDSTVYYTQNNEFKRSDKLFRRNVLNGRSKLIRTELDLTYDISVSQSKSYIYAIIESKCESEIYTLEKANPSEGFKLLIKRKENVYNNVKEFNGKLYALTNDNAINNKIIRLENGNWTEVVPHSKNTLINDFLITEQHIILHAFNGGFLQITYRQNDSRKWSTVEFPSNIYSAQIYSSESNSIRISYSSPNKSYSTYEFNLLTGKLKEVKSSKIKRQFERELRYITTKRLYAKAPDGTKVPLTISKSTVPKKKHKGLILKVYGAYGAYPGGHSFSADDLILMKDGFSIAYAHVRGGQIMGNQWYEDGKLLNKENTFNDYIACAEYLIRKKYTDSDHLVGYGQSAGGLVMGAVINRRPELFNTVILDHAYLDALTTMMNDTLPLTTDHYKEVGNPQEEIYYKLIKGYSPYQNIVEQEYPNLLFIAGSNDYQTPAWQIAKCVAQLRKKNSGTSSILFKTDIGSGHMGSTRGDQWIRDLSFMYGFIYGNLF